MTVVVKLFGPQARAAGRPQLAVELPPEATCKELRQKLRQVAPWLAGHLTASRFAVNHAFANEAQPLQPGDEVALIGMVSGG